MTRASRATRAPPPRCCSTPRRNLYDVRNSAPARKHVGVHDVDRLAALVGENLVEDVGELQLPLVERDIAEMRRADDVVHGEERMLAIGDRLVLVDIDRRLSRPAGP